MRCEVLLGPGEGLVSTGFKGNRKKSVSECGIRILENKRRKSSTVSLLEDGSIQNHDGKASDLVTRVVNWFCKAGSVEW